MAEHRTVHLGIDLFERHQTGLRLTRAGHQFQGYALNVVAAFEAAEHSVQDDATSLSGRVHLGMTWTLSSYFAFPVVERFTRWYPDVDLVLMEDTRQTIETSLIEGELDLALLLVSNLSPDSDLATQVFHTSKRRLWVSADHPLTRRETVCLADVATYPYALLRTDEAQKQGLAYWNDQIGRPNIKLASDSVEAVRSLVATGQAVTILSDVVYRPWTLDGRRVEQIDLADDIPTMDMGIAWSPEKVLSPAAERLRAAFCNVEAFIPD